MITALNPPKIQAFSSSELHFETVSTLSGISLIPASNARTPSSNQADISENNISSTSPCLITNELVSQWDVATPSATSPNPWIVDATASTPNTASTDEKSYELLCGKSLRLSTCTKYIIMKLYKSTSSVKEGLKNNIGNFFS